MEEQELSEVTQVLTTDVMVDLVAAEGVVGTPMLYMGEVAEATLVEEEDLGILIVQVQVEGAVRIIMAPTKPTRQAPTAVMVTLLLTNYDLPYL